MTRGSKAMAILLTIALSALMLWFAYLVFQRILLAVLVVLMLMLASG